MAYEPQIGKKLTYHEKMINEVLARDTGYSIGQLMSQYQMLPELRGFWPFSSVNESGNVMDLGGQARTLTNNGSTPRGVWTTGIPYIGMNGSTRYMSRGDEAGMDITGALTFGGWFYPTVYSAPVSANTCMAKSSNAAPNLGYVLDFVNLAGPIAVGRFFMTVDGTTATQVLTTLDLAVNTWHFMCARFTPSTELKVWADEETNTNTTAIPASSVNNNQPFTIGVLGAGVANWFAGAAALCFVCASAVSNTTIDHLYDAGRPFFEV